MTKLIRDTWLIFGSALRVMLRNPAWVFFGLFQPICYMLLFAPLLKNLVGVPGFPSGGAYNVFTPGLMMMMAIFGTGFAGFTVIGQLREGTIERLRVTPVSRLSLMLGMILVSLLNLLVQTALLIILGVILGFRPDAGGLALLVALILIGGLMMASCSYAVGLLVKDEGALAAAVNLVALPLLLLSGIMLPLSFAPDILQKIAKGNPFAYAVDASRALVDGSLTNVAVIQGFIIFGVLAVLGVYWVTRSIRKAAM
ncbi:MAG TPA: ABC transporter permease [Ktedonobacterales bacterium]|jgi:ABC-2 type transport system permease protein